MKYTLYLDEKQKKQLEYEVISREFKIYLTRYLEKKIIGTYTPSVVALEVKNYIINLSRQLIAKPVLILEPNDWGEYEHYLYSFNDCEFRLIFRPLGTLELIELLCELIEYNYLNCGEINDLLELENLSFRIKKLNGKVKINVFDIEEIQEDETVNEHINIRYLIDRMDRSLISKDYSAVLHTSATIFETLAKDIISSDSIDNQTLKSFFDRYRKDSNLPEEILNYILKIYGDRNTTPLAGHGSTKEVLIIEKEAIVLCEMTKAFVRIEYKLNTLTDKYQPQQQN